MIELTDNRLVFSFPEVHEAARLEIEFQRTLRIPDDGGEYPLPPGLRRFPLRLVDDFPERVPTKCFERGGVMLPMYQSEALWVNFRFRRYPVAVKIAAGKINAVTGDSWNNALNRNPQDYLVVPDQPWLDGYCVGKGVIRQFVAMPLGAGFTAEEQLTGAGEYGGIQLAAYPMKAEVYGSIRDRFQTWKAEGWSPIQGFPGLFYCFSPVGGAFALMGFAPGGRMRHKIYEDPFGFNDCDQSNSSRCFVHIANSLVWRQITGESPPTTPPQRRNTTRPGYRGLNIMMRTKRLWKQTRD